MNYENISNLSPKDLEALTSEQVNTLEQMREWLHDYNLGKRDKPNFPENARLSCSLYSEWIMGKETEGFFASEGLG